MMSCPRALGSAATIKNQQAAKRKNATIGCQTSIKTEDWKTGVAAIEAEALIERVDELDTRTAKVAQVVRGERQFVLQCHGSHQRIQHGHGLPFNSQVSDQSCPAEAYGSVPRQAFDGTGQSRKPLFELLPFSSGRERENPNSQFA
jgi:hypothetical protein